MSSIVHYSYHRGLRQLHINGATQFSSAAVHTLDEPSISEGSQSIGTGGSTELDAAPEGSKCIRLQVEDGKTCRYKIVNNANTGQSANGNSPAITGETVLHIEAGWVLSLISVN